MLLFTHRQVAGAPRHRTHRGELAGAGEMNWVKEYLCNVVGHFRSPAGLGIVPHLRLSSDIVGGYDQNILR